MIKSKMKLKKNLKKEGSNMANEIKNIVYIGNKAPIIYAASIQTQAASGEKEIHIKARGRSISKAVDVSQLVINRFLNKWKVKNVAIDTEELEIERENRKTKQKEKAKINVSTIDITIGTSE